MHEKDFLTLLFLTDVKTTLFAQGSNCLYSISIIDIKISAYKTLCNYAVSLVAF